MKIKILTSCSGLEFSFAQGDIVETTDKIGKDLVKAKYAEEVKTVSAKKQKTETVKGDMDAET